MKARKMDGIEARHGKKGGSIRLHFSYRGVECRETLKLNPTKANLIYAERLRGQILNAIGKGSFNYRDFFPDSKRGEIFGHTSTSNETVGDRLDKFMSRCVLAESLGNLSPSTLDTYEKTVRRVLKPAFGAVQISALTPAQIRKWVEGLGVSAKTVRNWVSPLRMVLADALNDGAIEANPLDRVDLDRCINLTAKRSAFVVEPFDASEIAAILSKAEAHTNLFRFAFATGLRTSELIAIDWADIDRERSLLNVSRAVVVKKTKGTKTKAGRRAVELSSEALAALGDDWPSAGYVFMNPNTGKPYAGDKPVRIAWGKILKAAEVRYRNPYQTRHTFASTLLSSGANPWKVAQQMGHETVEMIFKTYGRWVQQEPFAQVSPKRELMR